MKTHYCPMDHCYLDYEGECNWCGEKEFPDHELSEEPINEPEPDVE